MVATITRLASLGVSLALRITQLCLAIIELGLSGYTINNPYYINVYFTTQAFDISVSVISLLEGAFLLGLFNFLPPIFALVCEVVMSTLWIAAFAYSAYLWEGSNGILFDEFGDLYYLTAWPIIQASWALCFIMFLVHLTAMILIVVFIMVPLQGSPKLGKIRTMAIGSLFPAEGIVGEHESTVNNEYQAAPVYYDKEPQVGVQTVPISQPQQQVPTGNSQITEPPVAMGNNQLPPSNVYPPTGHPQI